MSVEKIVSTLAMLEKMHKSLLELAMKKTDCIKMNDTKQLEALLKNEQAHVAAIEKLELQRQSIIQAYLNTSTTNPVSMLHVIEATPSIEDKQQLSEVRERLVDLLARLKKHNDLNQKLVFQSLQFINISLEMMRPQQSSTMNYSGEEVRGQSQVGKKSYFDSQA